MLGKIKVNNTTEELTKMAKNEAKKTMWLWIFTGVTSIAASQLPLILKKNKNKSQTHQKKKPWFLILLTGVIMLGVVIWFLNIII
jgi:hypothetical protein